MADADIKLDDWVGTQQACDDPLAPFPARALAALLGRDLSNEDDVLPLPWHWLYAITPPESGGTGADGHPSRGGFLPPVPLPRRMWAGSDIAVTRPMQIGVTARRTSTVAAIERKRGRSGELTFVTVDHRWTQHGTECIAERQSIVYREAAPASPEISEPVPAILDVSSLQSTLTPDPVLLFRYSALTYNAHRIHYDLPYAQAEEGYPDLVVHGPLIATLLLDAARPLAGGQGPERFSFRAERPAFVARDLHLHAERRDNSIALWSSDATGQVGVRAHLDLAALA